MSQDPPTRVASAPPVSDQLTAYDRTHLVTYLRLLDAEALQLDRKETARAVLHLDPEADVHAARQTYEAHLARAHWMTETGYRLLQT